MIKLRFTFTFLLLLLVVPVLGAGHVETIATFDIAAGQLTEGVTVDGDGNIFVSASPLGQVHKITGGMGSPELFGEVSGLQEGDFGLLGVTANDAGDIYGAVVSSNPEANGVWKFAADSGEAEHIAGTEAIALANAIAFGDNGEIYVTDSIMGAVWVVTEDGTTEIWSQDPLLAGNESVGFGIPLGANGIDIRDGVVYVGVLEVASIVAIPILEDGSAGEASVWAQLPGGNHVDGIILDDDGNVIVAAVSSNLVLRVSADGSMEALATVSDGLDAPASVAYHVDADGNASIYVANFSVAVNPPGGAGPSVIKIDG